MGIFIGLCGIVCWITAAVFLGGGTDIHLGFSALLFAAGAALFGLAALISTASLALNNLRDLNPALRRNQ